MFPILVASGKNALLTVVFRMKPMTAKKIIAIMHLALPSGVVGSIQASSNESSASHSSKKCLEVSEGSLVEKGCARPFSVHAYCMAVVKLQIINVESHWQQLQEGSHGCAQELLKCTPGLNNNTVVVN